MIGTPILHFVFNPKSGNGKRQEIFTLAKKLCESHRWKIVGHEIHDAADIDRVMKKAADAAQADDGTLAAAGGDGTLRAAVQAMQGRKLRFAAIPGGTFNLFARTHKIPEDIEAALKLVFTGSEKLIRVGEINNEVFLINANLGLYAKAIHSRKAHTRRWGRHRIVAILATVITLLKGSPNIAVRIKTAEAIQTLRTPMIFIGNNDLQLEKLNLEAAAGMKEDLLAAFIMKPFRRWDMLRILFRGILKNLDKDPSVESFNFDEMEIELQKERTLVVLDGEKLLLSPPFLVRVLTEHVLLVTP